MDWYGPAWTIGEALSRKRSWRIFLYSHVYSHRVGTSRDEAGRAGTTNSNNHRKHAKSLGFSKADGHLENRWLHVLRCRPLVDRTKALGT